MFYLYEITNLVNQKKYVGITNNPHMRWWVHKNSASVRKARHNLAVAMREFGDASFSFEVVGTAPTQAEAFEWERQHISLLRSDQPEYGYNMTGGGFGMFDNPEYKRRLSEGVRELAADPVRGPEWRKHLSEGKKRAYAADPTYRQRTNKPGQFKGRTYSPETIERMKAGARRRGPMPEDQKQKIAASMKGKNSYKRSEETRANMSKAAQLRSENTLRNPEARKRMSDAQKNSAKALANLQNPERRKRHSELMKALWAKRREQRGAS